MNEENKPVDYYLIFNNWLNDGNLKSEFPKELDSAGYRFSAQTVLLNQFRMSQKYFPFINNTFNNYYSVNIPARNICLMLKEMIHFGGKIRGYVSKIKLPKDNELIKILKKRYPFFKKEEIKMLVDIIDKSEEKETYYDMFGLREIKKAKKFKKDEREKQKARIKSIISKDDLIDSL